MAKKPDGRGNEFTAEAYRIAAQEHVRSLDDLYAKGHYGLALYVAGLSVESIFRAYRCRIDPQFDSRHDLNELERAARFVELVPVNLIDRYEKALAGMIVRWSSTHRYRSGNAIRAFLRRARLNRGIKGDFLKENARRAIEFASMIVEIGITRWTRS